MAAFSRGQVEKGAMKITQNQFRGALWASGGGAVIPRPLYHNQAVPIGPSSTSSRGKSLEKAVSSNSINDQPGTVSLDMLLDLSLFVQRDLKTKPILHTTHSFKLITIFDQGLKSFSHVRHWKTVGHNFMTTEMAQKRVNVCRNKI